MLFACLLVCLLAFVIFIWIVLFEGLCKKVDAGLPTPSPLKLLVDVAHNVAKRVLPAVLLNDGLYGIHPSLNTYTHNTIKIKY